MNPIDIDKIAEDAQMIVCGYAFSKTEEGSIRAINLHAPHHALVMNKNNEVLETNMDDIEINKVMVTLSLRNKVSSQTKN